MCTYEGCNRPAYQNPSFPATDKCIFHCTDKDPSKFLGYLEAQMADWSKYAAPYNFSGWVFPSQPAGEKGELRFANFRAKRFNYPVSFKAAHFSAHADFGHAIFCADVDFGGAEFLRGATFDEAEFQNNVTFCRAVFAERVSFQYTWFERESEFSQIRAHGTIDLSYAYFERMADFDCAEIGDYAALIWPGAGTTCDENGNPVRPGTVKLSNLRFSSRRSVLDLRNVRLRENAELIVTNTEIPRDQELPQCLLLGGTDCRRIEFSNVRWPTISGRRVVGDEILARDGSRRIADVGNWNTIAITYQYLTHRYRKDLDHPVANEFERGIFEARLKAAMNNWPSSWRSVLLLGAYKVVSNFGGSILRPVWLAALALMLFSLAYGVLVYRGQFGLPHDWSLFGDSILAALRVAALDRHWFTGEVDRFIAGSLWKVLVSCIAIFQTVLTATLVTMFIFAVRRRFKHSE